MTVHLDTSALVEALAGSRPGFNRLADLIAHNHRLAVSSLALYEWLRGPRTPAELEVQQALMPTESACPFGPAEGALAASLYTTVRRPRGRDIDLAIAACAIAHDAALWTTNRKDFEDVPDLRLV